MTTSFRLPTNPASHYMLELKSNILSWLNYLIQKSVLRLNMQHTKGWVYFPINSAIRSNTPKEKTFISRVK